MQFSGRVSIMHSATFQFHNPHVAARIEIDTKRRRERTALRIPRSTFCRHQVTHDEFHFTALVRAAH